MNRVYILYHTIGLHHVSVYIKEPMVYNPLMDTNAFMHWAVAHSYILNRTSATCFLKSDTKISKILATLESENTIRCNDILMFSSHTIGKELIKK